MINKNNGHIIVADSIVLKPNSDFETIKNRKLGENQSVWEMKNGWLWINAVNIIINRTYFIFALGFRNRKLREMSFIMSNEPFSTDQYWNDFNKEDELRKLEDYKKWLTENLGSEKEFSWGSVWTEFDVKGGSSSIGIRYK